MPLLRKPRAARSSLALALCLVALAPALAPAQSGTRLRTVTLLPAHFLQQTVSLRSGEYGHIIQDHSVRNFDSELTYDLFLAEHLSPGIQGGQIGEIVDLGTSAEIAARHGYSETLGGGQGFVSIHFRNGQLVIRRDLSGQSFQPFDEGNGFLNQRPPSSSQHALARRGHIYLVRLTDRNDPQFERIAKLMVVAHDSGNRVTLVFEELRRDARSQPGPQSR